MKTSRRFLLVSIFTLVSLCFGETSLLACTTFGGPTVWDDQIRHVWNVSQSGNTLSGTESNIGTCGTGNIDSSNSTIFSGAITMKVNHPFGCGTAYTWFFSSGSSWSMNCDRVNLNYDEYNSSGVIVASGTFTLYTYPLDEASNTSSNAPPNDWNPGSYVWKATALTGGVSERHFASRFFYEENNPVTPNDNCWWNGISDTWRYDSLNKNSSNRDGSTGPYPNSGTWQNPCCSADAQLGANDAWSDGVGWGNGWWVAYYRQNSPGLIANGVCTRTVSQRVYMVADWGGGNNMSRWYRVNTHVLTIWWDLSHPNNDYDYWDGRNGLTNDWNIGSHRGGQAKTKVFPILDPPTNLAFGTVTSNSVQLTWSGTAGDGNQFTIWRSTDGANFTYYDSSGTGYTDFGVTSGNQYWYCVRSARGEGSGPLGTPDLTAGPCSNAIDTTTP